MNMKRLFIILSAVLMTFPLLAQYKVEESSVKKMPEWVNSVMKDYLNVTATGMDIEEAKAAALAKVKQQIAQSIATRIVSESNLSTSAYQNSDGGFAKSQLLESSIRSKTAKLPFIGEISLSKATDYYWEKRYYKNSKTYEYFYAVQYPFSEFEMKKLVMEYQEHERKLDGKLADFEAGLETITTIEEIDGRLESLRAFLNEFEQDDPRYNQVLGLMNRYRTLYDQITLDYYQEKKGVVAITMTLGGNPISTSQRPTIKSNCATKINTSYEGNVLVVRYDDENCYEEDENYLDIRFRIGNKYLSERVFIKHSINISLTGVVTDAATRQPVPYARITLIPGGKTATTGRNGMYAFNDLPQGTYSIQIIKKGYYTKEVPATIYNRQTSRIDAQIESDGTLAVPAYNAPTPVATQPVSQPAQNQNQNHGEKDPVNTVRNGLSAYFRFNGNTRSEISAIQGNPVNSPQYTIDSKDGTQAIAFSSLDESQLIFPKLMINNPLKNYTVSFWIKGVSDGHIFSGSNNDSFFRNNMPLLKVVNNKFTLLDGDNIAFSHPDLDYNWHFIAIVSSQEGFNDAVFHLYIDGIMVDSGSSYTSRNTSAVKFILGGKSIYSGGGNAVDMMIDNLRIYGGRALSEKEIAEIYMAEQ